MAKSVSDVLKEAVVQLRQVGVETPVIDAQLLMAKAVGCSRLDVIAHPDRILTDSEAAAFAEMIEKRAARCPVAYITGVREFYGLHILVSPGVLIPRPETELLVDECVRRIRRKDCCIADVGTGSGAVALAVARRLEHVRVYAVDNSAAALTVAAENIRIHKVSDRVELIEGDMVGPLLARGLELDAVVANPPYIPSGHIDQLEPEVRLYEPRQALDGGEDGLDAYRRLLPDAYRLLPDSGFAACEIGKGQFEQVRRIALDSGFARVEAARDLLGIERVVIAYR